MKRVVACRSSRLAGEDPARHRRSAARRNAEGARGAGGAGEIGHIRRRADADDGGRVRHEPRPEQLRRRACPGALDRLTIAPTVRLGSFDTLPVAGTRRGDGEQVVSALTRTCASGRWASLALHISRAEVDNAERIALDCPRCAYASSQRGDDIAGAQSRPYHRSTSTALSRLTVLNWITPPPK